MAYLTKLLNLLLTNLYTTGKNYLGDSSPMIAGTGFVDGDTWIKGWLEVGDGIISRARTWGTSLLTIPSTGLGTPSLGTCNFDYTGGTYENQFTATVQTGGWSFAAGDVGKMIVIISGTHNKAVALIEQVISGTVVVLETCGWDGDLSGESFMLVHVPITFTSRKIKLNVISSDGEWETHAAAHTGLYAVKLQMDAGGASITNERIVTDAAGYSNVDSLQILHTVGALAAGNIQKAIRLTIDDSLCVAGSTAEVCGITLNRTAGDSTATATGLCVGTAFSNALRIQGSAAVDPGYGYTFTAAFAVTNHVNLADSILAANEIRTLMLAHAASTTGAGAHPVADTVNFTAMPAASTDLTSLITLITYLLTSYAAHDLDAKGAIPTYHAAQYAGSDLASVAAPTTLTLCMTRLIDIKAKYDIHDANDDAHTVRGLFPTTLTLAGDASFVDDAVNTQMFTLDNTGILIGSDNPFAVIQYIQQVAGSATITPTWEYSTGDGTWAAITVSDTTTGMRFSGKVSFTTPGGWAKSAHCDGVTGLIRNAYYIRITRTANVLATPPTEQYFKIFSGGSETDTLIRGNGTIKPAQLADAAAPSDSIYYSTTASKLVYKDSGGTVRSLY